MKIVVGWRQLLEFDESKTAGEEEAISSKKVEWDMWNKSL